MPNGIDVEQVRAAPLPDQGYDVLFTGRPIKHKNVDVLLEAFDAVAAERDAIAHPDRVDFLGFLDHYEDVPGHMRAANVFASPSTREGFGITFLEEMAADCTVIAADLTRSRPSTRSSLTSAFSSSPRSTRSPSGSTPH